MQKMLATQGDMNPNQSASGLGPRPGSAERIAKRGCIREREPADSDASPDLAPHTTVRGPPDVEGALGAHLERGRAHLLLVARLRVELVLVGCANDAEAEPQSQGEALATEAHTELGATGRAAREIQKRAPRGADPQGESRRGLFGLGRAQPGHGQQERTREVGDYRYRARHYLPHFPLAVGSIS